MRKTWYSEYIELVPAYNAPTGSLLTHPWWWARGSRLTRGRLTFAGISVFPSFLTWPLRSFQFLDWLQRRIRTLQEGSHADSRRRTRRTARAVVDLGLQEEGYEVLAAADFSHWDEKDAVHPDVIVFNSHMTPASKVLWVKAIRALVPGVKVVDLATSVGSPPQSTGADAYVYPPHRVEELVAAIARITGVSPPPKGTPSEYPQHPG